MRADISGLVGAAVVIAISCSSPEPTATPVPTPTPLPTATPTPSPAQLIVGRWSQVNGSEVIRFFASGDLDLSSPTLLGQANFQGTYRFVGASEIRVELKNLLGTTTALYELRFMGDRMQMRDANGAVTEYVKAP